jgi:hypothetical protein
MKNSIYQCSSPDGREVHIIEDEHGRAAFVEGEDYPYWISADKLVYMAEQCLANAQALFKALAIHNYEEGSEKFIHATDNEA